MFVRTCMSTPVVTVGPDAPVKAALDLMKTHNYRRLPVVDSHGRLAGIVSERDLLRAGPLSATSLSVWEIGYLLAQMTVQQVMTRAIIITNPDTPIEHAASLMLANKIGGLPVVDERVRVIGIITETDIFRAFVAMLDGVSYGIRLSLETTERSIPFELLADLHRIGGEIVSFGTVQQGRKTTAVLVIDGISLQTAEVPLRRYEAMIVDVAPLGFPQTDRHSLAILPIAIESGV